MITLESLKRYLGITDNSEDVLLQELIDSVSSYIQSFTGRNLIAADYTNKKYNGSGERILILNDFPLNSITEIKYRDNNDFENPEYTLIEGKDFTFSEDGQVFFNFNLIRGFNIIDITYNAGYTTIPQDLQLACKILCGYLYNTKDSAGIKSENVEGVSIVFQDMSMEQFQAVNSILFNYKNYV